MSDAVAKFWNDILELREQAPRALAESSLGPLGTHFTRFDQQRETLLSKLRNASQSQTFDEDKAWGNVRRVAFGYFVRARHEPKLSGAECEAQCRKIANALRESRGMIEEAMRSSRDVADTITGEWWGSQDPDVDFIGNPSFECGNDELVDGQFDKLLKKMAELEQAAVRAADNFHTGRGRPKGTSVLPPEYVQELKQVFQESTGLEPEKVNGAFVGFLRSFLAAIGANISQDYAYKMVKSARTRE
jgi:hypothetical protein